VVEDELPGELEYVSDSCAGSWDGGARTWRWEVGDLPAGGRRTCELVTRVERMPRGTVYNTAVVSSSGTDIQSGNDAATAVAEVKQPGVPAVSGLSAGGFVLLLLGAGLLLLRLRS
jgi:hypothetical protein